mmetsp:Transcript_63474/g.164734  ORF Transcript_63474/g.164734 Transcript_63474/m.164734 type:complete len:304 (-) Transcript_63474:121-1032(-)
MPSAQQEEAALAAMAAAGMGPHVIWGNIEPASTSSDIPESSGTPVASHEGLNFHEGDGGLQGNSETKGDEPTSEKSDWWRRVPPDVRMYVNSHVSVNNEESSSTTNSQSGSLPFAAKVSDGSQSRRAQAAAGASDLQNDSAESDGTDEQLADPGTWSRGSAKHAEGKCRPCHYVRTTAGCLNAENCDFCHLAHRRKNRPRPHRRKRMQCKKYADMLEDAEANNPEVFREAIEGLSSRSAYLQSVVLHRLRDKAETADAGTELADPSAPGASSSSTPWAVQAATIAVAKVSGSSRSTHKQIVSL